MSDALASLEALLAEDRKLVWTQEDAILLCLMVESIASDYGCHVALTGGCLYKAVDGSRRKDCDLLFYRIRQTPKIDQIGLFKALETIGINVTGGFGWVFKATFHGKPLDLFFPEEEAGNWQVVKSKPCTHVISASIMKLPASNEPVTCPKCYKTMDYDYNNDTWRHKTATQVDAYRLHERRSRSTCGKLFINEFEPGDFEPPACPECRDRVEWHPKRGAWYHLCDRDLLVGLRAEDLMALELPAPNQCTAMFVDHADVDPCTTEFKCPLCHEPMEWSTGAQKWYHERDRKRVEAIDAE